MIFKRDLADAINDLIDLAFSLAERICVLESAVEELEKRSCECKKDDLEKAIEDVAKPKRRSSSASSKNKSTKPVKK